MPRLRVLAPLLALFAVHCGGDTDSSSGFASGQGSTPGQASFGSSGEPTTSSSTSSSTGTPTSSTSTGETTTGAVDPGTTSATSTGEASTSTGPDTGSEGSTGPAPEGCGDGVVQGGELCDDGNDIETDACLSDCSAGVAMLAVVGLGNAPATAASFTPGPGWSLGPFQVDVAAADLVRTPEGAMAVVRRGSAKVEEQDELYYARWQAKDPALFSVASKVGVFGFAKGRPALAAVAESVYLGFLGTDNKHYVSLYNPGLWAPFGKLPAGMVQNQAFGPSPATLAVNSPEAYSVYVGDDGQLYYSHKAGPGSIWEASSGSPAQALLNTVSPVAVIDAEADLVIAYVRKDGQIALIKLLTPMNAWSGEVLVHPQALTGSAIALLRLDAGGYALAWRGLDTQSIHLALSVGDTFDKWSLPIIIDAPKLASTPPVLVPGVIGAELEILFTTAGKLRHARVSAGQVIAPVDVPGVAAATTVAATRVQLGM